MTGETVYNLMRFNDVEVDAEDRPSEPPRLTSVRVTINPFDDVLPRKSQEKGGDDPLADAKAAEAAARDRRGRVRNANLLSFGDDDEDGDGGAVDGLGMFPRKASPPAARIRSAYDVGGVFAAGGGGDGGGGGGVSGDGAAGARSEAPERGVALEKPRAENVAAVVELSSDARREEAKASLAQRVKARMLEAAAPGRADGGRDGEGFGPAESTPTSARAPAPGFLAAPTARKAPQEGGKAKKGSAKRKAKREEETLAKLSRFKSRLGGEAGKAGKRSEGGGGGGGGGEGDDDDVDDDDGGAFDLSSHTLKFAKGPTPAEDPMARVEEEDDYVVFDPLLEKGKGRGRGRGGGESGHRRHAHRQGGWGAGGGR